MAKPATTIGVRPLQAHSPKIVIFGMSCVGKTTLAQSLSEHEYICFDALFQWHLVEALGLSLEANLRHVASVCTAPKFVLDGWHLSDAEGGLLPESVVYLVYAPYAQIIDQYRVPVSSHDVHRPMFQKWYFEVDYRRFPTRYFLNCGEFVETTQEEFTDFLERNQPTASSSGIRGILGP